MKNRIKELRNTRGLTLQQLSSLVHLSVPHISKIENHQRGLEVGWLEPFGSALGVSPIDILEGKWNVPLINSHNSTITQSGNILVGDVYTKDDKAILDLVHKLDIFEKADVILYIKGMLSKKEETNGNE